MTVTEYDNPLIGRYASTEMAQLWSPQKRIELWRRLWIILAEAERELGLPISVEQLQAMRDGLSQVNWDAASQYEKQFRHDVMAHVHAYGDVCPTARPILHWGATSCYVTDNADLLLMREALELVLLRLARVIDRLGSFAAQHRELACLAFTHLQPAQPTTVGKRACLWAYDLCLDVAEIEHRLGQLKARGAKGTTGTQASFLQLFQGDHDRVRKLDALVAEKMGFQAAYSVTGQTYPRKIDSQVLDVLSGIAQSSHKAATDLRILSSRREIEEPFEKDQVGSSAMAYKRNPMRCERICSLARFVLSLSQNAQYTAATQWMERTLDDSANRRLSIPQAFLAIDAILMLYENVISGLVVHPRVIERLLAAELPFMLTEQILMAAVEQGHDRQVVHEIIRGHSHAVAQAVKEHGAENDLLDRLASEPSLAGIDWQGMTTSNPLVGRAPQQVSEFIENHVDPLRARYLGAGALTCEIRV